METPTFFSAFHIVCLLLAILATVGVSIWFVKRPNDKAVRIFTLACWIVMVLFETYKQVTYAFSYNADAGVEWKYEWYAFPFQLCSSPLYLLPFAIFLKDGKVRDAFLAYLCTFSLFGGLVVMIYPGDVFVDKAMINIQSMVHHSIQVILGVSLAVFYRKKITWKFFLKGLIVYAGMIAIAQILNATIPHAISADENFNMFYISWKYDCTLPLLSTIYPKVPYIVFFLLYLLGFILIAAIVFAIIRLILRLTSRSSRPAEQASTEVEEIVEEESLPIENVTKRPVNCPHCRQKLYVADPAIYTCPHCKSLLEVTLREKYVRKTIDNE